MISAHVMVELNNGTPQEVINNIKRLNCEEYEVNQEMNDLANLYLKDNIITERYRGDALHIAIASVIGVNVLVSWNFKHIVNLDKIKKFNSVNLKEGYPILEIRTTKEMINYE